jgi:hypothetical protein
MLCLGLASSAEAIGHLGWVFLFPAIVGLFRPNHGGRQCWKTVPSGVSVWLDGTSATVRVEVKEGWTSEDTGGTRGN